VENARLELGTVEKFPENPLFGEEKPWEVRFDNLYANVIFDPATKEYHCWYSPFIIDEATSATPPDQRESIRYIPKKREMGVCYASSRDGIAWTKPDLGLVEFNGNRNNNLVARGPHGAGVMMDAHESDPAKRFKLFYRDEHDMAIEVSPDGLTWSAPTSCPEIAAVGDTHNQLLWAQERNEYLGFTRLWNKERGIRQVGWTHSADATHWAKAENVLEGDAPTLQVYSMPVFRYADCYIGLPAIFNKESDRVHTELAWSPDGRDWRRITPGAPFIPTSEQRGQYDWGCVYAAASPVFQDDVIRIYYGGSDGPHTGWRKGFLCLAMLRPYGFAGYAPIDSTQPSVITTQPIANLGRTRITADIAQGGSIEISVLDAHDAELRHSKPIRETVTDGEIPWLSESTESPLEYRLRFNFMNARIYAFRVEQEKK
jgi:hypothetical protein